MTLLAESDYFKLFKTKNYVSYNYIVFRKASGFIQEVARSMMLTKRITKYFTTEQIEKARKILRNNMFVGLC